MAGAARSLAPSGGRRDLGVRSRGPAGRTGTQPADRFFGGRPVGRLGHGHRRGGPRPPGPDSPRLLRARGVDSRLAAVPPLPGRRGSSPRRSARPRRPSPPPGPGSPRPASSRAPLRPTDSSSRSRGPRPSWSRHSTSPWCPPGWPTAAWPASRPNGQRCPPPWPPRWPGWSDCPRWRRPSPSWFRPGPGTRPLREPARPVPRRRSSQPWARGRVRRPRAPTGYTAGQLAAAYGLTAPLRAWSHRDRGDHRGLRTGAVHAGRHRRLRDLLRGLDDGDQHQHRRRSGDPGPVGRGGPRHRGRGRPGPGGHGRRCTAVPRTGPTTGPDRHLRGHGGRPPRSRSSPPAGACASP